MENPSFFGTTRIEHAAVTKNIALFLFRLIMFLFHALCVHRHLFLYKMPPVVPSFTVALWLRLYHHWTRYFLLFQFESSGFVEMIRSTLIFVCVWVGVLGINEDGIYFTKSGHAESPIPVGADPRSTYWDTNVVMIGTNVTYCEFELFSEWNILNSIGEEILKIY